MGEAVDRSSRVLRSVVDMAMYLDMPEDIARTVEIYYGIVRMVQDDGPAASIEMLRLTADGSYVRENMSLRARGDVAVVDVVDQLDVTVSWNQLDMGLD